MKIRIEMDPYPENPRKYYDTVGTMVCFHDRYSLGDTHDYNPRDFSSWEELKEQIIRDHSPAAILPLFLLDHNGITISTRPFRDPWDSMQVGFIFTKENPEDLEFEVELYDQYLRGEVCGFIIEGDEGEVLDSCWGIYGEGWARELAEEALEDFRRTRHVRDIATDSHDRRDPCGTPGASHF